jgi:hypothetical protein
VAGTKKVVWSAKCILHPPNSPPGRGKGWVNMNININIEHLILDGIVLSPYQRPLVQAAVEAELTRLLTEGGLAASMLRGGAMPSINAAPLQLTGANNPIHLGQQIARSIYGGIGQ